MPTTLVEGKRVKEVELLDLFPSEEGKICQYYGRIGSGKTYAATADILELLRRGNVVKANWKINYQGYDERSSIFRIIITLLFPFAKRFYNFPKENFQYIEISDKWAQTQGYKTFDEWVRNQTDCHIFLDEGHLWIDSYQGTRISMEKRTTILHTRHFNRSIYIVSQRPTAIHVSLRANVNVFYKCEKIWKWGNIVRFKRTEYQDMQNETVDEDPEKEIDRKYYWGSKKVFESYDTKYLRGDMVQSQKTAFEAYELNYFQKIKGFFSVFHKKKLSTSYPQLPIKLEVEHLQKNETVIILKHVKPRITRTRTRNRRDEKSIRAIDLSSIASSPISDEGPH